MKSMDCPRESGTPAQIADLRLAASKMSGTTRRSFQAEMTLKYCDGNARLAERVFGWGRNNIEVGLAERRSGIVCVGAFLNRSGETPCAEPHAACCGG
ncbi:MAG TPA: hypothetical protein V6C65_32975 [Allocoleopsis sp.]